MNVTVIEGDKFISLGLRLNLARMAYHTTCYDDDLSAFNDIVVKKEYSNYDLIIIDVSGFNIHIFKLLEYLSVKQSIIPTIMINTSFEAKDFDRFMKMEHIAFVHKPFTFSDIKQEIYRIFNLQLLALN